MVPTSTLDCQNTCSLTVKLTHLCLPCIRQAARPHRTMPTQASEGRLWSIPTAQGQFSVSTTYLKTNVWTGRT